ncbi:MAG: right-handed parallel beta-helix repeat-containing protein [Verrucomicrobia bacterium]|nr:right-handed parallel beta-helix repeat-containing protein [Verrucomicrobiota bacterium]
MSHLNHFGAKGDGKADDTAAIQHFIEQCDGHVALPRGDYRITKPLEIDLSRLGRTAISGTGGVASLIMDGPGPAIRLIGTHGGTADPNSFKPGVWAMERMPTVSAIEIVGAHDEADGIELSGTMQPTLSGVFIRQCRYGVHLVKRNRNVLIADSHIYHGRGPAIGIYFDGVNLHQTNIVGCHISYCRHAGIKIQRSEIRNFQVTGCDIEYNFDETAPDSADVWIDARESTVREGTIASCTIQAKRSPGGANVRIEGSDDPASRKAGLWTIAGNVIQSQETNLLLRSCRGVVVTGNSFCSGYERNIVIEKCRNIVVGSNTLDYNPDYKGDRVDGITVRGSSGINLHGLIVESARAGSAESGGAIEVFDSSEIAIANCQVFDPLHRGLHLDGVRNAQVSNCAVHCRQPQATMREAVLLRRTSRDVLLPGNLLARGTAGDVTVE